MRSSGLYALAGCNLAIPGFSWILLVLGQQHLDGLLGVLLLAAGSVGCTLAIAGLVLAHRCKDTVLSSDRGFCQAILALALVGSMGMVACWALGIVLAQVIPTAWG